MAAMKEKDALKVAGDTLVGFIADALTKGGLPRDDAREVGELMIAADLLGGDGHGIFRLPRYLDRLKAGDFNVNPKIHGGGRRPIGTMEVAYIPAGDVHCFHNTGDEPLVMLFVYDAGEVTRTFAATGETVRHLADGDVAQPKTQP